MPYTNEVLHLPLLGYGEHGLADNALARMPNASDVLDPLYGYNGQGDSPAEEREGKSISHLVGVSDEGRALKRGCWKGSTVPTSGPYLPCVSGQRFFNARCNP